jgi:NADH:ubiquinone oxidoreductase subunit
MKIFLLRLFTWWNGQTLGTQWWTWLYGEFVGEDEFGNRYYRTKGSKIDPTLLIERRWVIYNGVTEASAVPPSWHGWLHHTVDLLPTEDKTKPHPWEKPHLPNLTGTPAAHRPSGSTLAQGRRPKATGDYKAWSPGNP